MKTIIFAAASSCLLFCLFKTSMALTFFGTEPFHDIKMTGPQVIPGRIMLPYYDFGGEGKAYHCEVQHNFGSCALNPCEGENATYLNLFRADESPSISYTKRLFFYLGSAWSDIWHGNHSMPEPDIFYWGWLPVGTWVRVSVDVAAAGSYNGSIMYTAPNSGTIELTFSDSKTGETIQAQTITLPTTEHFHDWDVAYNAFDIDFPAAGDYVMTVNVTSIGGNGDQHFGNFVWMDILPKATEELVEPVTATSSAVATAVTTSTADAAPAMTTATTTAANGPASNPPSHRRFRAL